jgi:hypothetical protein
MNIAMGIRVRLVRIMEQIITGVINSDKSAKLILDQRADFLVQGVVYGIVHLVEVKKGLRINLTEM